MVDNRLTDVVIRLERLEQLVNNRADNKRQVNDNKSGTWSIHNRLVKIG